MTFKVIKSGTDMRDFHNGGSDENPYIKLPHGTLLFYKNGSQSLYSHNLAGSRTDGCDCCARYYTLKDFNDVVSYQVLNIED